MAIEEMESDLEKLKAAQRLLHVNTEPGTESHSLPNVVEALNIMLSIMVERVAETIAEARGG